MLKDRLCGLIIEYRKSVLILVFIVTIIASAGIPSLVFRSDYNAFFSEDYAPRIELIEVERTFTENKNLLIAIAPEDKEILSKETLSIIKDFTEKAWLIPYVNRVDSLTNYQYIADDGDDILVGDLVPERSEIDSSIIERVRLVSLSEPEIIGRLVAQDFSVAAIHLSFQYPDKVDLNTARQQIFQQIGSLLKEYTDNDPATKYYVTGTEAVDYAIGKYSQEDAATLFPVAITLMLILLVLLLSTVVGALFSILIIVVTTLSTMGLVGWIGIEMDAITAMSPIIILTLAMADSVHLMMSVKKAGVLGIDNMCAVHDALRENIRPISLTSLTTILGVVTFSFADLLALKKLGWIIAIGVGMAWFYTLTLLPVMLTWVRLRPYQQDRISRLIIRVVSLAMDRPGWIIPAATVIVLLLASQLPKNEINESVEDFFDRSAPERYAVEFVSQKLSGSFIADVAIFSGNPRGVSDPDFLQVLEEFTAWLREEQAAAHVVSIADTFKRLNATVQGSDAFYMLPESEALAAQYLLMYEMSLPYGLGTNNILSQDQGATRMLLTLRTATGKEVVELKRSIFNWFSKNAPSYRVVVTGVNPVMGELAYLHLIPSMLKGGMIAIAMVCFVLMFSLAEWRLGLLGMLVNIIPIFMAYGLWGASIGLINFSVMAVAGICLGVVVDFGVHVLVKYGDRRRAGGDVKASLIYAYEKTGRSLAVTMVTLVSGFFVLSLSHITLNAYMGLLTGVTIFLAFVFDLIVLPALIVGVSKRNPGKIENTAIKHTSEVS